MMNKRYTNRWFLVSSLLFLILFVVIFIWALRGIRQAAQASAKEGMRIAEQAVRQAAVSCYALEGAYPATYEDLKARSGIMIDENQYIVFYDIFASNIIPEITILERQAQP